MASGALRIIHFDERDPFPPFCDNMRVIRAGSERGNHGGIAAARASGKAPPPSQVVRIAAVSDQSSFFAIIRSQE